MNRYACHFKSGGCIILNAIDDEEAAWLADTHARIEGSKLADVMPLDAHHCTLQETLEEDYYV